MILLESADADCNDDSVAFMSPYYERRPSWRGTDNGGIIMLPRSVLLLIICLGAFACYGGKAPKENPKEPPLDVENVAEVCVLIRQPGLYGDVPGVIDEKVEEKRQYLIQVGEKAFPTYEAILTDPKSESEEIAGVFWIINHVKSDRTRFRKYALERLADPHSYVRDYAVRALKSIGSSAEAPSVVPLLSDEEEYVATAAAETLAAIGGPDEVLAMDVWIRGHSHRNDRQFREHVQKCRDELKKRLDAKKTSKK